MTSSRKRSLAETLKQAVAPFMSAPVTEADLRKAEADQVAALDAVTAQIGQMEAKRAAYLVDYERIQWLPAKQHADRLTEEIEAATSRKAAIEGGIAELRRKLADVVAQEQHRAAIQRVRDIARIRADFDRSAQRVQKMANDLAGSLQDHGRLGRELMAALKGVLPPNELGMFDEVNIDIHAREGLYRPFVLDRLTQDGTSRPNDWRWLRWEVNPFSNDRRDFLERQRDLLDRLVGFFATRKEADKVRERLDPSGTTMYVVRDDEAMVFRLVSHRLAGDYESAQAVEPAEAEAGGPGVPAVDPAEVDDREAGARAAGSAKSPGEGAGA